MTEQQRGIFAVKVRVLNNHINDLVVFLDSEQFNRANAVIRLRDITSSFKIAANLVENLITPEEPEPFKAEWEGVRNAYYAVVARVEDLEDPHQGGGNHTLTSAGPMGNSTFIEKQLTLKLPVAELPKFSGDHNHWLSYKNSFLTMIDSRTDVTDLTKLMYLRNTLLGEALNKIYRLDLSAENYPKAWQTLVESYERKRILVSQHLDAILDISPLLSASSKELTNLADEVKQQLSILKSLGVDLSERMVVRILERALPPLTRDKWEDLLTLDELPTKDKLFTFIQEASSKLYTREKENAKGQDEITNKVAVRQSGGASKARKNNEGTRVMVTSIDQSCLLCKQSHSLFRCPEFSKLQVQKRWDVVKANRLCYNCLRSHQGKCGMTHCKRCEKYHNTLLHSESKPTVSTLGVGSIDQTSGQSSA